MLSSLVTRCGRVVRKLHEDDGGMEAIQSVVILAVSALVLVGLHAIWQNTIKPQTTQSLSTMFGLDFTSTK